MFRKKIFLYINLNCSDYHQRKTTCTFIYIQKAKKCETFIHTKSQILCKKQDNFHYAFIYKKTDTLRYVIFHENFGIGIRIQKA